MMKRPLAIAVIVAALTATACTNGDPGQPGETVTVTETVTETITPTDGVTAQDGCDTLTNGEELAFIFVTSPMPGAQVGGGTINVEGCSNTFEAAYQWELVDREGNVVAEDFGQASCGTGCVGTFSFDITHGLSQRQVAWIHVFDESAEDGSRVLETVIPVVVGG